MLPILALLAIYRLFVIYSDNLPKTNVKKSGYPQSAGSNGRLSVQSIIRQKTGIKDVYGYKNGMWLANKTEDGIKTHYLFTSDAVLLAQTSVAGSIYTSGMPKLYRLHIKVDSGLKTNRGDIIPHYGALDDNFNITIPAIYDELKSQQERCTIAKKGKLYGVYNASDTLIIQVDYDEVIHDSVNERLFAFKDGVWCLFSYRGELITALKYTAIYPAKTGYIFFIKTFIAEQVEINEPKTDAQLITGKWGLLDVDCNELIPAQYALLYQSPDYAVAMNGQLIVEEKQPWPGMKAYYSGAGGKWGVLDFNNRILIPFEYSWVDFTRSKNLFLVNQGGNMYYVKSGQRNGFWGIQGGKWGLLNTGNEPVVSVEYDQVQQADNVIHFQKTNNDYFDFELPYETVNILLTDNSPGIPPARFTKHLDKS